MHFLNFFRTWFYRWHIKVTIRKWGSFGHCSN